ncbi:MAG: aminotransferase class III-fold pyridoxal phosphate-dependent enzyme, partial [Anaerolineales bacterium]
LNTEALTETLFDDLRAAGTTVGIGRYDEARLIYTEPMFAAGPNPTDERRTIHIGLDVFAEAGMPVFAPLPGTVHAFANNAQKQDYGPVIVLRHETDEGLQFFTLYGHLSRESLNGLSLGQAITSEQRWGAIGEAAVNGAWPPHLHFQILTDTLDLDTNFPGVAFASQRDVWKSLSPDPNIIVRVPLDRFPAPEPSHAETLAARRAQLGGNLNLSYRNPLKIVRGWKQFLYDETGRAYLDVYNNVPLVGHSHPRVVQAAQQQLALLNTNTRYLHDNVLRYAERLTALMPEPLRVCYFLNSASEANELALRLARAYTQHHDIIVLEHAYHGHTTTLIDISPYKFNGPGGAGKQPWVHVAPLADDYRGPYKRNDPDAGRKYAARVNDILTALAPTRAAAFIAESAPSVSGQIVFPPGYLSEAYRHVRAAGGVCIADEVQVGFGRLGAHFWGFASQGVVPDIVVLGKPIGNAFPLAAVVTTPAIAAAFDNGMEFFSTFGGNPVACAAGLAVLDVLKDEALPENALRVGDYLRDSLCALMNHYPLVGDVRGMGLFLGVELVRDRDTLEPAGEETGYIVNRLRERGILCGADGSHHNVLKLRPPLCFTERDADLFVATLDEILAEDGVSGIG